MYRQDPQFLLGVRPVQTSRLSSSIFTGEEWQSLADWLGLSPRELRMVQGVFNNCKANELAGDLNLSPPTVHTHLRRLFRQLGVTGRVALVVRVLDAHLRLNSPGLRPPSAGHCPLGKGRPSS
jgi:DNA-binding CsgD family transcriptional regulator